MTTASWKGLHTLTATETFPAQSTITGASNTLYRSLNPGSASTSMHCSSPSLVRVVGLSRNPSTIFSVIPGTTSVSMLTTFSELPWLESTVLMGILLPLNLSTPSEYIMSAGPKTSSLRMSSPSSTSSRIRPTASHFLTFTLFLSLLCLLPRRPISTSNIAFPKISTTPSPACLAVPGWCRRGRLCFGIL